MSQNDLFEWARRLDSQQTGEPELDLAASLQGAK